MLVLCEAATVLVGVFVGGDVLLCADRSGGSMGVGTVSRVCDRPRSRVVGLGSGCAAAVAGVTVLRSGLDLVDLLAEGLAGESSIDAMAGLVERVLTRHASELRASSSGALVGSRAGAVDVVSAVVLAGPRSRDLAMYSLTLPVEGPVEQQVVTSRVGCRVFAPPPVRLDMELCAVRANGARSVGEAIDCADAGFRQAACAFPTGVSAEWDHLLVTRPGSGRAVENSGR